MRILNDPETSKFWSQTKKPTPWNKFSTFRVCRAWCSGSLIFIDVVYACWQKLVPLHFMTCPIVITPLLQSARQKGQSGANDKHSDHYLAPSSSPVTLETAKFKSIKWLNILIYSLHFFPSCCGDIFLSSKITGLFPHWYSLMALML